MELRHLKSGTDVRGTAVKPADPRLETISLIVSAMGGSIDTMLSGKSAKKNRFDR